MASSARVWVDIERLGLDVDEHRLCAPQGKRGCRGDIRIWKGRSPRRRALLPGAAPRLRARPCTTGQASPDSRSAWPALLAARGEGSACCELAGDDRFLDVRRLAPHPIGPI